MDILRRFVIPFLVLALMLGISIGLLLGWQVWPVSWYDTDPSDLKQEHQVSYILMAADSLAVNGNSQVADQRLEDMLDKETDAQELADLIERVAAQQEQAGDQASALRVRRLALAAQLPAPSADAMLQKPDARPGTVVAPSNTIVMLGSLFIFLLAATIAVWALIELLRRRTPKDETPPDDETDQDDERELVFAVVRSEPSSPAPAPSRVAHTMTLEPVAQSPNVDQDLYVEELDDQPAPTVLAPRPVQSSAVVPAVAKTALDEEDISDLPPDALGVWESEYRFGDDDFDTAFSIESETGDFLGECGMGVGDVLGHDDGQRVDAFEVWLFDKDGIHTESKMLVSEFVYAHEGMSAQLSEKGELVVPEVALSFTLETLTLQMTVTVKALTYLPDAEMPESAFERLAVEMLVERSD